MLRSEFEARTGLKVTEQVFVKIHDEYLDSELSKDDWCRQWLQNNLSTKDNLVNQISFEFDGFVKAKKFETAIKALCNLIKTDQFGMTDANTVLDEYRVGVDRWQIEVEKLGREDYLILKDRVNQKGNNCHSYITPWEYYDFWQIDDNRCDKGRSYFRLNIELLDDGVAYISVGWRYIAE